MLDLERRDADAVQGERNLLIIFDKVEGEAAIAFGDLGIEGFRGADEAPFDALWTGDDQGPLALACILCLDQEPREAAEMVTMQMADANHVDVVGGEPEPAHSDQSGNAAVDEKGGGSAPHVERGLELPTCAKSVPATYDGLPHNGRTSPFENLFFSYATASVAAIRGGAFRREATVNAALGISPHSHRRASG